MSRCIVCARCWVFDEHAAMVALGKAEADRDRLQRAVDAARKLCDQADAANEASLSRTFGGGLFPTQVSASEVRAAIDSALAAAASPAEEGQDRG